MDEVTHWLALHVTRDMLLSDKCTTRKSINRVDAVFDFLVDAAPQ